MPASELIESGVDIEERQFTLAFINSFHKRFNPWLGLRYVWLSNDAFKHNKTEVSFTLLFGYVGDV